MREAGKTAWRRGRFKYARTKGQHSRRKQSNELRHRGAINPGRSRESGRLWGRQKRGEEWVGRLGRGHGTDHSPRLGARWE